MLSKVFIANAIIALPFAILFIFFPAFSLRIYGAETGPVGLVMARLLGGEFLCFALIDYLALSRGSDTQNLLALGSFVGFFVGAVVLLLAQLSGVFNVLGWSLVLTYVLFTLGYALCLLDQNKGASVVHQH